MMIQVTQEHIDKGVPGQGSSCALALAIKEQTGKKRVHVSRHSVVVGRVMVARLTKKATRFTIQYDAGRVVRPTSFRINFFK